jgi:hypothetical protein
VQDLVCSTDIVLQCGRLAASWENFIYALEGYSCYSYPNNITNWIVQTALGVEVVRRRHPNRGTVLLDEMLDIIRPLQTARLHDKIYAAASILQNLGLPTTCLPIPNYKSTANEVYQQYSFVLNAYPEIGGYFCALSMVEDSGSRRPEGVDIPSWSPDWSIPWNIYRLNTKGSLLSASKGRSAEIENAPSLGTMTFKGCIIDALDEAPHYLPPRRFYDKYAASGDNSIFFSYWYELAQKSKRRNYKSEDERYFCLISDHPEEVTYSMEYDFVDA